MREIETRPETADTLVFPLGLLCRHAIELALKGLIVWLHEQYAEVESLRHTHNLPGLWQLLRNPLAKLDLLDEAVAGEVEELLAPFHELDSAGMAFRYPVDSKGAPSFSQSRLNCRTMYERALEVLGDLERIGGAIFDDLERRDEAMRDAANEWWYSLTDEERAEREREDEALYEAYLNGHL